MKSINIFRTAIFMLLLVACSARSDTAPQSTLPAARMTPIITGNVYYVAVDEPGASDDNNGRYPGYQDDQNGPWLTIQHAANMMTGGDITYIREGIYYEAGIIFANPGAPGAPITLANYESDEVILDGSKSTSDLPGIGIIAGRDHYVIQGLTIRNMPWSGIYTDEDTTDPFEGITIRDCILHNNGWTGIDLHAAHGFVVENAVAYDNVFYGINLSGSGDGELSSADGIVRNSSTYNQTGDEGHGVAINQGHDIIIRDSVAYHNTVHGFDVSDWPKRGQLSYNITIENNFSYDNGVAGFAINSDSHHVLFRNNVAWKNGAAWAGLGNADGFYCYEGCWHVEWYHNVSLENSGSGFGVEDVIGRYVKAEDNLLVFKNNIAYNNNPHGESWGNAIYIAGKDTWQVQASHNNWSVPPGWEYYAVENQVDGYSVQDINRGAFQTGNISVDPQFVDAGVPDVHLRPGSPCIDTGEDIGWPYHGAAPDMGAFEFGGDQAMEAPTAIPEGPAGSTTQEAPPPEALPASGPSDWLELQEGAQGTEVFALQYLLRCHGHTTTVSGQFGSDTREAVIAFQAGQGLDTDGLVGGIETWPALVADAWVQEGDQGDCVFAVQYLLNNKYEYNVEVNGDFGPQTEQTVRQFQKEYDLYIDGIVGAETWQTLISLPAP